MLSACLVLEAAERCLSYKAPFLLDQRFLELEVGLNETRERYDSKISRNESFLREMRI